MKTKKMTEKEAYSLYDDMLNELYPLEGIACNAFSTLLLAGDPTAEWEKYIAPNMRSAMICLPCYNEIKMFIDKGAVESGCGLHSGI